MIGIEEYKELREKYWDVASWTIWSPAGERPKSNIGDLSVFNDPDLLQKINTGFVFVALNGSGVHDAYLESSKPWFNFHSDYSRGHDYKMRYAMTGTPLWGSYITDIIKYYQEVDSSKAVKYVKSHPEVMKKNIEAFKDEIRLLGGNPVIIALGDATYNILKENLNSEYHIIKVKHYSFTIGKEEYRKELLEVVEPFISLAK